MRKIAELIVLICLLPVIIMGAILFIFVLCILKPFGYEYCDYPDMKNYNRNI